MSIDIIRAALEQADRERPHLKEINTFGSCLELLERTLQIAGPEWALVGKSLQSGKDGSGIRPGWFTPRVMSLVRPDGQREDVLIDAVSQDAAWHIPTKRQYKVIANSTANEPGPWEHGPARLTPYPIEEVKDGVHQYRWHNPPIAQPDAAIVPAPGPVPPVQPPTRNGRLPSREEALDELNFLDQYYASKEGLDRKQGLSMAGAPDFLGVAAWYLDVYQNARLSGASRAEARAAYISEIRHSNEWKAKHPGETP